MRTLRLLGISVTLLCLSMTAFAGETDSPPCAPGETDSPPCAVAQRPGDDCVTQNQVVFTVSGQDNDYLITDVTVDLVRAALSVF